MLLDAGVERIGKFGGETVERQLVVRLDLALQLDGVLGLPFLSQRPDFALQRIVTGICH